MSLIRRCRDDERPAIEVENLRIACRAGAFLPYLHHGRKAPCRKASCPLARSGPYAFGDPVGDSVGGRLEVVLAAEPLRFTVVSG